MEIEKHEFIHIKMHILEAEKIKMLLDDIRHSDMQDWAKKIAKKFSEDLENKGVK